VSTAVIVSAVRTPFGRLGGGLADRAADERIRRDTTLEKLAALKPVFDPEGTTTAGNAPADEESVNVNGGAVALGHLIGASGARIVGTRVHEPRRNGGGLGLAASCSGGGQGDAVLVEV
jgi:acetyl-CoA acetyltransferase